MTEKSTSFFFGLLVGLTLGLLISVSKSIIEDRRLVEMGIYPDDLPTIVESCERDLPRSQNCEIVINAVPVKSD